MEAGYSGTPLVRKLGISDRSVLHLIGEPEGYRALLKGARFEATLRPEVTWVQVFATQRAALATT
jgi:hypothetical protein